MEVLHPTKPSQKWNDEDAYIGVCILAGINALYVQEDEFESICEIAVRQLDNLISYQSYFDKAAENFAQKYRSLAIGTLNFAGLLAQKGIRYDTPEAAKAAADLAEKISYYSIKASIKLAKERGVFEFFNKTKWSHCELPIDRYCKNIDEYIDSPKLDWEALRQELGKYGIRNSTLTGYMPVESSSIVSGSTSGIEPIRDYIVSKTSKAGKIVAVAPNLKRDFVNYSLAFDLPIEAMQLVYAAFSKYTCMAISANNYVNVSHYENKQVPLSVVVKDTLAYFNLGGKTQYYFNTEDDSGEDSSGGCAGGACSI
jgi:ribonucleoside-diphosphate reductase alpha chain